MKDNKVNKNSLEFPSKREGEDAASKKQKSDGSSDLSGYSPFQLQVLETVKGKLNMMLSECCQLKKEELDFSNSKKLCKTILEKIATGEVKSVHINTIQAKKFLAIIGEMSCRQMLSVNHFFSENLERPENEKESVNVKPSTNAENEHTSYFKKTEIEKKDKSNNPQEKKKSSIDSFFENLEGNDESPYLSSPFS